MSDKYFLELVGKVNSMFPNTFTEKQRVIASLLAFGYSRTQIAEFLGKSESTIKDHTQAVVKKLKLNSSRQVSAWVIERLVINGTGK